MRRSALPLALAFVIAIAGTAHGAEPPCLVADCTEKKAEPVARASGDCPTLATLVCAGGDLVGGAVDAVEDIALAPVKAAGDAAMDGLTSWVAGGASWLLNKAARLLERSSRPALGSSWFKSQYATALQIALALSVLFLLCAVLQATLRHDLALLARTALVALPLSILLCFAAVTLVETALGVTDWMTGSVLRHFKRDTGEFFTDVGEILVPTTLTGNPLPGFLVFLGALITALATFVVWLELVMREAAIYVAVVFLPLCFSAMVWQRTAHWCRRLVEFLAGVILAKFAIATAVALAAGAMSRGGSGDGGLTALVAGAAVMLIAALTPWLLLRLVPITETAGHTGLTRSSVTGAAGSAPGAGTASMVARQAVLSAAVSAPTSALSAVHAGRAAGTSGARSTRPVTAVVGPPQGIPRSERSEASDGR